MNTLEDKYKMMFGAYLGMTLMDEYDLKAYVLRDIENYIKDFIKEYPLDNFNYQEFMNKVDKEESDIVKLQDTLRIGVILDFNIELKSMIKKKIRKSLLIRTMQRKSGVITMRENKLMTLAWLLR